MTCAIILMQNISVMRKERVTDISSKMRKNCHTACAATIHLVQFLPVLFGCLYCPNVGQ